jgi:hypothetical protein
LREKTSKLENQSYKSTCTQSAKSRHSFWASQPNQIPRAKNSKVDELAKAAAQANTLPSDVFYETLHQPSIELNAKPPKLIMQYTMMTGEHP